MAKQTDQTPQQQRQPQQKQPRRKAPDAQQPDIKDDPHDLPDFGDPPLPSERGYPFPPPLKSRPVDPNNPLNYIREPIASRNERLRYRLGIPPTQPGLGQAQ